MRRRPLVAVLFFVALLAGAAGCGDAAGASDLGMPPDLGPCEASVRTCTSADVCGAPCPADKSGCTDHGCFEPYVCLCEGDLLVCHAGVPLCGTDMAHPATD